MTTAAPHPMRWYRGAGSGPAALEKAARADGTTVAALGCRMEQDIITIILIRDAAMPRAGAIAPLAAVLKFSSGVGDGRRRLARGVPAPGVSGGNAGWSQRCRRLG